MVPEPEESFKVVNPYQDRIKSVSSSLKKLQITQNQNFIINP